jgi:plasmid stabilization system protein ParE
MTTRSHHVTLLSPDAQRPSAGGLSGSLPPDLLEQVRKRVGILALLLAAAFAFDPVFYYVALAVLRLTGGNPIEAGLGAAGFRNVSGIAALASIALWRAARSPRISAARLHTIGLIYEVAICLTMGILAHWQFYLQYHILPTLTWIPAVVILFPLLLPGPPRRMLVAAITAGAMAPLSIVLLQLLGKIDLRATPEAYLPSIVGSAFAVVFAWMGAKVIYGLGREVAVARELGSYQLEERLGQGGMGEVWRARHRLLARPAAIKLIRPTLAASPEVLQRFEREAQVIAGLRSPHTVNLFDFGVATDGAFYYVMELLDGLDADRLVRRFGPQPADRVVYLLRQVCHSLSEAESLGLVHRDIKPANIFLCRYGEEHDFVKVLDFGIVKTLGDRPDARPGLTRENTITGSPHFMAPEQAMGEATVDRRADIYATGCVAYWLLTGRTLFETESPMGQLVHHANTPPAAPSTHTSNPIPGGLERLVMECLAKDPAARPQSARELSRRLAQISGAEVWTEERAQSWWQENLP